MIKDILEILFSVAKEIMGHTSAILWPFFIVEGIYTGFLLLKFTLLKNFIIKDRFELMMIAIYFCFMVLISLSNLTALYWFLFSEAGVNFELAITSCVFFIYFSRIIPIFIINKPGDLSKYFFNFPKNICMIIKAFVVVAIIMMITLIPLLMLFLCINHNRTILSIMFAIMLLTINFFKGKYVHFSKKAKKSLNSIFLKSTCKMSEKRTVVENFYIDFAEKTLTMFFLLNVYVLSYRYSFFQNFVFIITEFLVVYYLLNKIKDYRKRLEL